MSNTRDAFNKRLRLAVREATVLVRGKAQEDHDYTSHSGELEKSVETRFIDNGLTGEAYLDTNIASYGPFVHKGDPFLYNALKSNKTAIDEIFARHTERAVSDIAGTLRDRTYTVK